MTENERERLSTRAVKFIGSYHLQLLIGMIGLLTLGLFISGILREYPYTPMDYIEATFTFGLLGFAVLQYQINKLLLEMEKDRTRDSVYKTKLGELRYALENLYGPINNIIRFQKIEYFDQVEKKGIVLLSDEYIQFCYIVPKYRYLLPEKIFEMIDYIDWGEPGLFLQENEVLNFIALYDEKIAEYYDFINSFARNL